MTENVTILPKKPNLVTTPDDNTEAVTMENVK